MSRALINIPGDIENTAAAQQYRGTPMVEEGDRELNLQLRNSLQLSRYRSHPMRPSAPPFSTEAWRQFLRLRELQAGWRRRRRHFPITPSAA